LLTVLPLAFLGGIAVAGAQSQNTPNQNAGDTSKALTGTNAGHVPLTQDQQKSVAQGLSDQQKQSAPAGYDGQVGSKVPDSMRTQSMPDNVTAQVPVTDGLLFVRLPDRVLLIDPNNKAVLEIVADTSSTSSGGGNDDAGRSQGGSSR
jgi:hypothetical protein